MFFLFEGLKVAITLRYLATGDHYKTLSHGFRVPNNTLAMIIRETCIAIIAEYKDLVKCPTTAEEWKPLALEFGTRWNFWHALGALDGKHCALRKPKKTGSVYHNYKGFFSMILMALVDASYKFIWVEVGGNGARSDEQIYNRCQLKTKLENGSLCLPEPDPLPGDDRPMPYFFIGDDAFALNKNMMKPYSRRHMDHDQRIYNYRCSRARRVVENAFGILASRFQCLLSTFRQKNVDTIEKIIMACVVLHNLLRTRYPGSQNILLDKEDLSHNWIPGQWRQGRESLRDASRPAGVGNNRDARDAKAQRDYLKEYYNSPLGAVPWQEDMI